jgi:hypothetical protein
MKHHTDEVMIRFATRLMWASLALALGIGLGFGWRSIRLADKSSGRTGCYSLVPAVTKEATRYERSNPDRY